MFTPKANSKQKCVKRHKNAKIEVLSGDTVLLSKRKQRVAPGEMENITITKSMLEKAGAELTVNIGREDQ